MSNFNILQGNSLDVLKTLPDKSINCCVTSPPYYALRDYGCDGQIGLEQTPDEYISKLVVVFHEVKRLLKDDGTLWINIADSWWGSGSRGCDMTRFCKDKSKVQQGSKGTMHLESLPKLVGNTNGLKNKDIIGIPWMLAFALRNDGWYLRQDIIWHKPNPMPESVTDRCTKSHEYIFLLSKSNKYYYDHVAIQEDAKPEGAKRYDYDFFKGGYSDARGMGAGRDTEGKKKYTGKRNKRDVWTVNCGGGYTDGDSHHYATYPQELITPCILAGSKEGDTVIDPFSGTATTGVVALKHGRNYVGVELNSEYAKMSIERLRSEHYQTKLF